ncbi:hypothetical protein TNCV_2988521 [Trichonephila clavipes]|nr:hypothetical protein TNCV_2988521 [Trichonephila clavipes]
MVLTEFMWLGTDNLEMELVEFRSSVVWKTKFEDLISEVEGTQFESRADNIDPNYQMIQFIHFCEVWFLPESVARVAAIVGDHRCHTPWHPFKETGCVLGVQQTKQLPHVTKVDLVLQLGV